MSAGRRAVAVLAALPSWSVTLSEPFGAADDFKLSITQALAVQLAESLRPLRPAPLTEQSLRQVADRKGIYELFLEGRRVYVGKASKSLSQRLGNHRRKLSGRTNLSLEDVSFVCLYVEEDLEAAAPETLLLKNYRRVGDAPPWNNNGFGNKDPGRRRDTSQVKANHFDAAYPIDLDAGVELSPRTWVIKTLLVDVKSKLPYLLRYETTRYQGDFHGGVDIDRPFLSLREFARVIVAALPQGWQLTALPGYAILYKESADYDSARMWWRAINGAVVETRGLARVAPPMSGGASADDDDTDDQGDQDG